MSVSTLDFLSGLVTPDFLRNAAKATGETESGVSKALGAAFPAVLGQLAQGAGDPGLMGNVISMIKNPAIGGLLGTGGGVLSSVGSLLAPTAASGPVGTVASTLLNMLFGKNIGGIIGALGSLAGLKNAGSASSLLSLAGPMVLAVLGNRLGGSVTGAALGALLGKEKSSIMGALPGALSGAMGLMGGAGAAAAQAAAPVAARVQQAVAPVVAAAHTSAAATPATVHHTHEDERGGGSSIIGSIIGLLITGAILAAIVFALSQCNPKVASIAPAIAPKAVAVAEIMKAFPTAQIKIGGYTDNQGDPAMNLKLSDDRAKRVKSELAGLGIAGDRVAAEGYGEQHAVAHNGSAEGRAENRRTALSVRQR